MHRTTATVALSLVMTALLARPALAGADDKRLDVYWCDTEGGAATLIVTPAGESVLIDAGNPGDRDANRIFKVATEQAHLHRIDHLVTTHYHVDHFGGAAALSKLIPIGTVWDNGDFHAGRDVPSPEYREFECDARKIINPGDEIPLKRAEGSPPIHLKCIAARQQTIEAPAGASPNSAASGELKHQPRDLTDNANSVTQVLSFGDFRFYDAGDLTWDTELKLVSPVNLVGPVDVYQVTHHGLDVSNNPVLVTSLSPTVAIMGNGPLKGCGTQTVATLRATPSIQAIFQLHRNLKKGEDQNNVADAQYIANNEATDACQGNFVKLSVDPAAKTYTVSIPATKLERTFGVKEHK